MKLCSFKLVLQRKVGKDILEFLEMIFANSLALLEAEDKTSGPLNSGRIADITLLRTLLAIRQKLQEPCLWELIDSLFY